VRLRQRLEIALPLLLAFMCIGGATSAQVSKSSPSATSANAGSTSKHGGAAARLSAIVASGRLEDLRWPNFSDYRSLLTSFYRPSGYNLAWVRDGEPTAQALELIQTLQGADREGLRAEDYDASRWPDRLKLLKGEHKDADEARFDAALTVCVMRYLSDLQVGRIDPRHLDFEFDVSQKKLALPQFVRQRLVDGSDLRSELAKVGPSFAQYQRLRDAMQRYMELAKSESQEKLPFFRVLPGEQSVILGPLASRLRFLGDLPESVTIPPGSNTYEGALVDAVKHFQARHGLEPTGILDREAIIEMNVPLSERVEQMRLGLERYRWLPYRFNQPAVVINVPALRLYCYDEGDRLALSMRVNVGDLYDFQTPMFEKNMLYVVFRPYWNPPPGILRNEIIPQLAADRSLEETDLELVSANGQVIKSASITPELLQQIRSGKLTVRQQPGPENALGLVKFIFPNEYHIYIHDTPVSAARFLSTAGAVSHGCIHAEKPAELAAWALQNNSGWDLERVEHAMHEGRNNVQVNLASPIPVMIVYQTAVVGENGEVRFFPDIYKHDATLEEELAKGYPYSKQKESRN
jgi:L,D-transpeptidase YcbB